MKKQNNHLEHLTGFDKFLLIALNPKRAFYNWINGVSVKGEDGKVNSKVYTTDPKVKPEFNSWAANLRNINEQHKN